MSKIKAVFFDLDNTLIDFMRFKRMCLEGSVEAMIDAGLDMDKNEALNLLFEIYDKYGMEYKHVFDEFLKKAVGKVDYKILASGIVAYRQRRVSYLEPYPHVIPTLLELMRHGIKLGIITDAPVQKAWLRLCAVKLHHFFDIVVTYDDTKKRKPNREPFLLALKKAKVKAKEALYVGDRIKIDIEGAKKLGMKTCLAKYGAFEKQEDVDKADYIIEDISELIKIVLSHNTDV